MNINLVFLIVLCNMLAYRGSKVLITLFAIELGAPQFYIGTLVAMYSVFPLLLALYAGKLTDRLGVRTPMLCGSAGVAAGLLLPFLFPVIPALYASAALIGTSHVFYNVAVQNLVGILSAGAEGRTRNFSNYGLVMATSSLLGPLAAGFSIDQFGHATSYLYLAAMPVVSVLIVVFARTLDRLRSQESGKQERVVDARSLLANAPLRRTLITGGIVLTGTDLFQFYMPIYGHAMGLSASAIGVVISMFAAAAFVVRLVMPAMVRRWGEDAVFIWSLSLGAATYLMFPLFESAVLLAAVAFVLGLGMGCGQPLAMMLIYERAPQGRAGEALGLRQVVNHLTHMAVPLVFGTVGSALGVAPVFIANSLLLAGGGILVRSPGKA
ncbi:MAG: MFS transporter [Betaproteobacteria bacterium]|nr:MFS transporter [Betaproteobacteria bacterium]